MSIFRDFLKTTVGFAVLIITWIIRELRGDAIAQRISCFLSPGKQEFLMNALILSAAIFAGFTFGLDWKKYGKPSNKIRSFLRRKIKYADKLLKTGLVDRDIPKDSSSDGFASFLNAPDSIESSRFLDYYVAWRRAIMAIFNGAIIDTKLKQYNVFMNRQVDKSKESLRVPLKSDIHELERFIENIKSDWIKKDFDSSIISEYEELKCPSANISLWKRLVRRAVWSGS